MSALGDELRDALDDPFRDEWGGYPWEHLGDAERDVRVLLDDLGKAEADAKTFRFEWEQERQERKKAEAERDEAREIVEQLRRHGADWVVDKLQVAIERAERAEADADRLRERIDFLRSDIDYRIAQEDALREYFEAAESVNRGVIDFDLHNEQVARLAAARKALAVSRDGEQ